MNTVIAFACLAFVASVLAGTPCKSTHSCKLESLGCFKDKKSKRVMPKLIEYDRSIKNTKYENLIDWKHFGSYVKNLGCRCAKRAAEKGFNVIGLQFYGECWSGPDGEKTYDDYGPGECVNGKFESSKEFDCSETHVGTQWSNEVYRIATPGCSEKFEPVGCYNDDLKNPRPLPNYILNERDPTHKSWNGKTIDWKRWKTYVPGLICRCAKKAKENKHTYFAIQHWGECWSGNEDEVNYARNGVSKNCRNEYFKKCSCNSYLCVGMEAANYVYKFRDDAQCGS